MFLLLPVGDDNPKERTPYVNYAILAANLLFFLMAGPEPSDTSIRILALHPTDFNIIQLFTSMFLHAGWMHMIGNMLFLWIFGDNVEDRLGHAGYAIFYLAWGVIAALSHVALTSHPEHAMLGASGAISGVIGAYIVFFPQRQVRLLLWILLFVRIYSVRAVYWLGFWFLQQLVLAAIDDSPVAYAAHIGGFIAGAIVAAIVHYLIAPLPKAAAGLPSGLAQASRATFARVDLRGQAAAAVSASRDRTYAVLATGDSVKFTPEALGLIAAATGEPLSDVTHRVRKTRGVIARNIDLPTAELVAQAMKDSGIATVTASDDESTRPPLPIAAGSVAWSEGGIGLTIGDNGVQIPWSSPTLVVAARCDGKAVIDVICPEVGRVRITEEIPAGEVDPRSGKIVAATLDRFAQAVLRHRTAAWLNEGVRVLAHRGQWGWLEFPSEAEYEDYLFWIFTLIQQGARRAVR